jgi:hypothetical protein
MMLANSSPRIGRPPAMSPELLDDFGHALLRLVGLHRRQHEERPLPARVLNHALRAVAPVLVEPQVAIEARRGEAAEVAHHGVDGEVLGLTARLGHVTGQDHGLRRARTIDQIHAATGIRAHGATRLAGAFPAFQVLNAFSSSGTTRGQRGVAGDDQRGALRAGTSCGATPRGPRV